MIPSTPSRRPVTSLSPTYFTKILKTLAMLILALCVALVPCQAQNTPPELVLKIAMTVGNRMAIPEDIAVNSLLGYLEVFDKDKGPSGEVTCRSESNYVGLAVKSPNFYLVQLENHLDREVATLVDVVFLCTDNGSPPLSQMANFSIEVKDANDNKPRFTQAAYTFSLMENNEYPVKVGQVIAVDQDAGENAVITYFLEDEFGEIPSSFEIDEKTGAITCTSQIDREKIGEVVLYVYSEDHGIPPLHDEAEVRIEILDVNDNTPTILSKNFSIEEGLNPMSLVGTIKASDKDAGRNSELEFSLVVGEDGLFMPPFIVDADGNIFAAVPLDRERRDMYVILVSATDSGANPLSTKANITITVDDANDNRPTIISPMDIDDYDFGFSVNNSGEPITIDWYTPDKDKLVYKVSAIDKDIHQNGRIFYSIESINSQPINDDSLFHINKDTGQVFLRRSVRSDDDPVQVLSFLVYDGGIPPLNATASLNVTLDIDFTALPSSETGASKDGPSTNSGMSQDGPRGSASRVTVGFLMVLWSLVLFGFSFVY